MKVTISKVLATGIVSISLAMFTVGCDDSECCGGVKQVSKSKPVSIITGLPSTVENGTFTVNGEASNDKEDGKSLKKYEWYTSTDTSKTSCAGLTSVASGSNPTISNLPNGTNRVFLKVTDSDGNTDCSYKDVSVNNQPKQVSCVDKLVHNTKPTAVLNVFRGSDSLQTLAELKSFDKLNLTCDGSKDECDRDIVASGGKCEYNGKSFLSDDPDCSTIASEYISDCKENGELKENSNTGEVTVDTCGDAGIKYNCVKFTLKVTDAWGNVENTSDVFKAVK
jgi:uncharacterized protein with beta-barrel porin domain